MNACDEDEPQTLNWITAAQTQEYIFYGWT